MVAMATVCASKKLPRLRGIIRMKTTLIVRALIPASRGVGSIGVSCAADCPFFVPFASKLYVILAILSMAKGCDLGLIRFGGHLPKGEYDVDHGGQEGKTDATELHRGLQDGGGATGPG
jgi:hypothetical protein